MTVRPRIGGNPTEKKGEDDAILANPPYVSKSSLTNQWL